MSTPRRFGRRRPMLDIFVGRQPIFNRRLNVVGYELLFRKFGASEANVVDGDLATSQVILNTFMEIGLDRLVGDGLAFINLTRRFLIEESRLPAMPGRVVLEVLEDIEVDEALVKALRRLSRQGYQIALDDVVHPEDVSPLLEIADIVKVDLLAVDRDCLEEYVATLRAYNVRLLAEKVETYEDIELCQDLGFGYFQGFFLSRPKVVSGRRMPASRLTIVRMLAELQNPYIEFGELEEIVRQDVSLSYKLLRLINSAFFSLPTKITTIRQALTLLGIEQVQAWLSLLLLSKVDDKPSALITTAMTRAKMCELLATASNEPAPETDFIVGLFSVLDALLDLPMEEIVATLPLSNEVTAALLKSQGHLGAALNCVRAYERGDWDAVSYSLLTPEDIRDAYLESLDWTAQAGVLLEGT
ncbi:MAG: HDOD domain-containing protein [Chloroflexi bacterium]|nr:HDOD domain-containing protein [Chloroflexota bacterium]